jgi:DivIVA domain-containing protein
MEWVTTAIDSKEFETVRRGYETAAVDAFLASLRTHATTLEDQLRLAHVKVASLEKKIAGVKEREAAAEAAYVAAAEAKQNLLNEAEARAAEIVRSAAAGVRGDGEDGEDGEGIRRDAERILLQAKKQLKAVERERAKAGSDSGTIVREAQRRAEELVAQAQAEAADRIAVATEEGRKIVTEARRVALATVAGSQSDAADLLTATRFEQNQIIEHLRALKEAVAEMLESGAKSSDRIRVILGDGVDLNDGGGIEPMTVVEETVDAAEGAAATA